MFSKSLKRMLQGMKSSRFKYAVVFSLLVLVLVFSAAQANGPMRPPHPPMPPHNMMWGMKMPKWRPWVPMQPVPKIKIIAVVEDLGVVIQTQDFPKNQDFTVTMGRMYTRGINGFEVGSFNSGDGSSQYLVFFTPEELYGQRRISIRAQTAHRYPYYAFNWFYNTTAIAAGVTEFEELTAEEALAEVESSMAAPAEPESAEAPPAEEPPAEEPPAEEGVGGAEAESELTGVTWQWTEFSDPVADAVVVENPEQYTLQFLPEGLIAVQADCNNGSGTYIVDEEGGIDIAVGAMTLALCPAESLSDQFVQYINDVAAFSFDGADLLLDLPVDGGTLRFAAAGEGEAEAPVEEATATVTGTVTYLQRIALPDDAVITVQVINVSVADAPAEVLGEQVIETGGQQVPIPFEVTYNPDEINENLMYGVSARLEDGEGNLLFINDTVIPVITQGSATEDVEIMTVPVAASEAEAPAEGEAEAPVEGEAEAPAEEGTSLTGVVWSWTEFADPVQGTSQIENPEQYTVEFFEDGTVGIVADCNSGGGSYVAAEGSIDITVGAVTLALCPEDSLSDQFLQYLGAAAVYFFEEGDLFMDLPVDSGTLRFSASAEDAEAGTGGAAAAPSATEALAATTIPVMHVQENQVDEESPVPSFTICSVTQNESIFIVTENFPAGQEFAVKMGPAPAHYMPMPKHPMPPPKPMPYPQGPMKPDMGNPGMGQSGMGQPGMGQPGMGQPGMGQPDMGAKPMVPGGTWQKPEHKIWIPYYEVGTLETGEGGQLEAEFSIPEELAGTYRISIVMRTAHQYPYLSYNWFYNNTADVCNGEVNGG